MWAALKIFKLFSLGIPGIAMLIGLGLIGMIILGMVFGFVKYAIFAALIYGVYYFFFKKKKSN